MKRIFGVHRIVKYNDIIVLHCPVCNNGKVHLIAVANAAVTKLTIVTK
jgi:hypothetical protein